MFMRFLRAVGVVLMAIGIGAVMASVEPLPETPLWWIAATAVGGFASILAGYKFFVWGGGKKLIDSPWGQN